MDGPQDSTDTPWQFKPGDTIVPGQAPEASTASAAPEPAPAPPEPAAAAPQPALPAAPEPVLAAQTPSPSSSNSISWTASEFIAHNKSAGWYLALAGVSIVLVAGVWFLTRDMVSAILIALALAAFGAYGARAPRALRYELGDSGLAIGEKHYSYDSFRSFAVIDEGAFASITFMPLKRFAPLTTIYYDPADEDKIVALLTDRLPVEDRPHDAVDRFMRRIRY